MRNKAAASNPNSTRRRPTYLFYCIDETTGFIGFFMQNFIFQSYKKSTTPSQRRAGVVRRQSRVPEAYQHPKLADV